MKIAVLGAGGMLGHKMVETLLPDFPETIALVRKHPEHYKKLGGIFSRVRVQGGFDARNMETLDSFLNGLSADVIINCIGLTTRKLGGSRESDILVVNSVLPNRLKEWCVENGKRLFHFSTDCVFSGKSGPYSVDNFRDAKDLYGQSKALGEVGAPGVLTIRSSIVGLEVEGRTELLEWFRTQGGKQMNGFRNVMYSGVTTNTMASVVSRLLKSGSAFGGIEQLASEPISKFELLSLANELFQVGAEITPVDEPRSNKVLKQSQFFNDHGIRPASWREQLGVVAQEIPKYESQLKGKVAA